MFAVVVGVKPPLYFSFKESDHIFWPELICSDMQGHSVSPFLMEEEVDTPAEDPQEVRSQSEN